jgi:methylated-DNA-protein-cysteine methyltransferase-like protein
MDNPDKKNFFRDVYDVVKLVPEGRVTSYGAIAHYLGTKGSARMVGWALNSCAGDSDIPAHRVVNRMGRLTGKQHFATPHTMQKLLEQEGHAIVEDAIVKFDTKFWDPGKELLDGE